MQTTTSVEPQSNLSHEDTTVLKSSDRSNSLKAVSVQAPGVVSDLSLEDEATVKVNEDGKYPEIAEMVNQESKSTIEEQQNVFEMLADLYARGEILLLSDDQERISSEEETTAEATFKDPSSGKVTKDVEQSSLTDSVIESPSVVSTDSSTESECPWHETAWQEIKKYAASVEKPADLTKVALKEHLLSTSCIHYCLNHPDVQFSAIAEIVRLHSKSPADVQQRAIAKVADFIAQRDNPDEIKSLRKTPGIVPEAFQPLSLPRAHRVTQHVSDVIIDECESLPLTTDEAPKTDMVDYESVTDMGGKLTTLISRGEDVHAGSETVAYAVRETSVERGPMASANVTQAIHETPEMRRSIVPPRTRKPSKWRKREEKKVLNRPWHRVHWKYMVRTNHIMKELMKAPRIEILYAKESPPFSKLRRSMAENYTITPTM